MQDRSTLTERVLTQGSDPVDIHRPATPTEFIGDRHIPGWLSDLNRHLLASDNDPRASSGLICACRGCAIVYRANPVLKPVAFGIAFFLGGHLLESTVLPLELYYEHRNYLPSFGDLPGIGGRLPAPSSSRLNAAAMAAGAVVVYFAFFVVYCACEIGNVVGSTVSSTMLHSLATTRRRGLRRAVPSSTSRTDRSNQRSSCWTALPARIRTMR